MTPEPFTICIPWRPSPSRIKPYECVRRYWAQHFPDTPVVVADSTTEIFSLSQARNNAVRQAQTDTVLITDADTIIFPVDSIHTALSNPLGVCWPHRVWRLIPAEYADRPFDDFADAPALVDYPNGLGGCMVVTQKEYWRLGGHPEEFTGWGSEDKAFHLVTTTLSTFRRIGGIAYSIEHNERLRVADSPGWHRDSRRNEDLLRPYEIAAGNPELMQALLQIRDEPRERYGDWRNRRGLTQPDEIRRKLFGDKPKQTPPAAAADWKQRWTSENDPSVGRYKA